MWNRQIPMNKADRVIFFCCLLILSVMCTSFRWPLSTVKLTSTFGESRGDHLHDGVDIVSYDTRVYPVADSAVLYAWNSSYFPFENFTGSGNYLILDHGETASIYLHLEDSLALSPNYTTNQSVGHFANTGRSYGAHIHFGLYDRISWDSINFFSVIEAPQDDTPPVVDHMAFYIDGTYTRISNNASIRLTQHYPLLLNVYDTISKGDRFGIYKMTVYVNGEKKRELSFDGAKLDKNNLTVDGIPFQSIYQGNYFKIPDITYREGVNRFRVIAEDYRGNTTEENFSLNIKLDIQG